MERCRRITLVRRVAAVLAVLGACAIFCVSAMPGDSLPPDLGVRSVVAHFCEYMLLAALVAIACTADERHAPHAWKAVVVAVAICSLYGVTDELHQYFVPGRFSDPLDWLTDTCGALVGASAASAVFRRIARRWS